MDINAEINPNDVVFDENPNRLCPVCKIRPIKDCWNTGEQEAI